MGEAGRFLQAGGYVLQAIAQYVLPGLFLSWLPGWLLRWRYPVRRCQQALELFTEGTGPHIWLNPDRASPAIDAFLLRFFSALPFPVIVESLRLRLSVNQRQVKSLDLISRVAIAPRALTSLTVHEWSLTENEAKFFDSLPDPAPVLTFAVTAQMRAPVGDFERVFEIKMRAFVFRGAAQD